MDQKTTFVDKLRVIDLYGLLRTSGKPPAYVCPAPTVALPPPQHTHIFLALSPLSQCVCHPLSVVCHRETNVVITSRLAGT